MTCGYESLYNLFTIFIVQFILEVHDIFLKTILRNLE